MAHFDCVVDTNPMAEEVHGVRKHVDATTTAVVGMQVAVVKAQKEGADRVCKKVNQGFYALIHSQISQKMATLQSKVDAQLMRLNQQRKQLLAIRSRMERDYQMISARYSKLFTGLNRNLRQRIVELDRPILDFASTEADKVSNRSVQMVSVIPLGQSESIKTSQRLSSSNLKYRAANAISSINSFIEDSNRLKAITDRILLRRPMHNDTKEVMLPVCLLESNFDSSGNLQFQSYVSNVGVSSDARMAIENRMSHCQREGDFNWSADAGVNPEIANSFRQMVASSGFDTRLQKTMLQLFEKQGFETL